jgi:hypothetical protein
VSYSGGGGSVARHAIAADGSFSPMFAGANASSVNSGGGGGGSGYYGGAQGTWNNIAKPNNLHGAGGGGSSFVSPQITSSCVRGGLCQYGTQNASSKQPKDPTPSNYIVFGWPSA